MKTLVVNRNIIMPIFAVLLINGVQNLSYGQNAPDTLVQFSDRSLAIMVHIEIAFESGKPPNLTELKRMPEAEVLKIPQAALTKMTTLSAGRDAVEDLSLPLITDLTGLDHATQLSRLYLRGQDVTDIAPLAQLTQLTSIDLWGNKVVDVTPLAQLTQLTELDLGGNSRIGNYIADITPLAQLTQLRELHVASEVVDITPVAQQTQLTKLVLGGNEISDISPWHN